MQVAINTVDLHCSHAHTLPVLALHLPLWVHFPEVERRGGKRGGGGGGGERRKRKEEEEETTWRTRGQRKGKRKER